MCYLQNNSLTLDDLRLLITDIIHYNSEDCLIVFSLHCTITFISTIFLILNYLIFRSRPASMSSDHSAAISAAARALSPPPSQRSKSPKPSSKRPKPASRSSSTESNASTSSIAALQTHPSKNKTPLRAAETVYYDAQSGPSASETSSTAPVKTADSRQKAVTVTLSKPKMQPPVFIESSMSDWRTSEMAYEVDQSSGEGQYLFYKDFQDVIPGEHMYRFKTDVKRDGWSGWLVDESSPTG